VEVIGATIGVVAIVLVVFAPLILIALFVNQTRKNNTRRRQTEQTRQAQMIADAVRGVAPTAPEPVPWWKR
jgi:type II secretory pathway pseudopilin PulG